MSIVGGLAVTAAIFVFGGIALGMIAESAARTWDGEVAMHRVGITLLITGLAIALAAVWTAVIA